MIEKGYWATHKYKRHSVERDVEEFVGWPTLETIIQSARQRDGAFAAIAFETGGRITEVRMLHHDNFILTNPDVILVRKMRLLKRFHRETDSTTGKKRVVLDEVYRKTFPISRSEPLTNVITQWVETQHGWLFPSFQGKQPYLGRTMAYNIARRLGNSIGVWIYPHWFRAQRASQLRLEYGFDTLDLMEFFGWEDVKTAIRYAKMGWRGLAEKMGVR